MKFDNIFNKIIEEAKSEQGEESVDSKIVQKTAKRLLKSLDKWVESEMDDMMRYVIPKSKGGKYDTSSFDTVGRRSDLLVSSGRKNEIESWVREYQRKKPNMSLLDFLKQKQLSNDKDIALLFKGGSSEEHKGFNKHILGDIVKDGINKVIKKLKKSSLTEDEKNEMFKGFTTKVANAIEKFADKSGVIGTRYSKETVKNVDPETGEEYDIRKELKPSFKEAYGDKAIRALLRAYNNFVNRDEPLRGRKTHKTKGKIQGDTFIKKTKSDTDPPKPIHDVIFNDTKLAHMLFNTGKTFYANNGFLYATDNDKNYRIADREKQSEEEIEQERSKLKSVKKAKALAKLKSLGLRAKKKEKTISDKTPSGKKTGTRYDPKSKTIKQPDPFSKLDLWKRAGDGQQTFKDK